MQMEKLCSKHNCHHIRILKRIVCWKTVPLNTKDLTRKLRDETIILLQTIKHFWKKRITQTINPIIKNVYNVFDFHWIYKKCKRIKQLEREDKWEEANKIRETVITYGTKDIKIIAQNYNL